MRLRIANTGMLGIVMLEGNLEQQNALELKIRLRSALCMAGRVIVNCEGVTAVSSACLKELCWAYRLARHLEKSIIIAGHRPDVFLSAAAHPGEPHCSANCRECGQDCIWTAQLSGDMPAAASPTAA